MATLRRALQIDGDHAEARIYLANLLYDRGDYDAALYHMDRTTPDDHWDELAVWRLIELRKSVYRLSDEDPELKPWVERLAQLTEEPDEIDEMLGDIEQRFNDEVLEGSRNQLELFGALLADLAEQRPEPPTTRWTVAAHRVQCAGATFDGSWADIVRKMRDADASYDGLSLDAFMSMEAQRAFTSSGITIPTSDPEAFIRGSAEAGLLRIVR